MCGSLTHCSGGHPTIKNKLFTDEKVLEVIIVNDFYSEGDNFTENFTNLELI